MTDSNDKVKFWSVLVAIMLGVSVAVLLIDMTIKAAILEESNALRRTLLGVQNDRSAETSDHGTSHNGSDSGAVLGVFSAGMEAGNVANGNQEAPLSIPPRSGRSRTKPRTQDNSGEIPPGA